MSAVLILIAAPLAIIGLLLAAGLLITVIEHAILRWVAHRVARREI